MKLDFDTDDGIGTRATFGAIVLETDETLEPEFARMMALDGVALYHSRIPMVSDIRPETLGKMEADLPAAARLLPPSLGFDVIGYGCTSASTVIGSDRVAKSIQSVFPRAKVTDPLKAIIAACQSLKARQVGFITPYIPQVSQRMRQKLEDAGLEIRCLASFEEGDDPTVARISPASIVRAAERVAEHSPCDVIVISCTNLRCLDIIPTLEDRLNRPVISSNQALAWHMQRLAGIDAPHPQFGRLFGCDLLQ